MRTINVFRLFFLCLLVVALMYALVPDALASGDCRGENSCNTVGGDTVVTTGDMVGGETNVSTGGNKTFAFAYGMGDVDINEGQNCYGSEQWGTVIVGRQTMELNAWCAALFYELNGRHERAAALRCTIKDIVDTHPYYGDEMACIKGEQLRPDEPQVVGEVPAEVPVDEYIEQQIQMAVDEEVADQHEQVEYRIAQQSNLIESLQQENNQLRHQIRDYVDQTEDIREWAADELARKERAQAILAENDDEES